MGEPQGPASDEHLFACVANPVGPHLLRQYNEMHDQSQSHVLTSTRDRESIMLTVRHPRTPTAQSDVHHPFRAATQRHRRTGIGTDRIRLSAGPWAGLTCSLPHPRDRCPNARPCARHPPGVQLNGAHVHGVIRTCVLPYLAHDDRDIRLQGVLRAPWRER